LSAQAHAKFINYRFKLKMTEDEHIKYIMTSEVGALLCKGFAYLYREQPQFPIRKLGEWLLSQGRRKLDHHEISHRDSKK
jgi:hypothetical protein